MREKKSFQIEEKQDISEVVVSCLSTQNIQWTVNMVANYFQFRGSFISNKYLKGTVSIFNISYNVILLCTGDFINVPFSWDGLGYK